MSAIKVATSKKIQFGETFSSVFYVLVREKKNLILIISGVLLCYSVLILPGIDISTNLIEPVGIVNTGDPAEFNNQISTALSKAAKGFKKAPITIIPLIFVLAVAFTSWVRAAALGGESAYTGSFTTLIKYSYAVFGRMISFLIWAILLNFALFLVWMPLYFILTPIFLFFHGGGTMDMTALLTSPTHSALLKGSPHGLSLASIVFSLPFFALVGVTGIAVCSESQGKRLTLFQACKFIKDDWLVITGTLFIIGVFFHIAGSLIFWLVNYSLIMTIPIAYAIFSILFFGFDFLYYLVLATAGVYFAIKLAPGGQDGFPEAEV